MSESKKQTPVAPAGLGPLFLIAALLPGLGYLGSIGLAEAKRWGAPTIEVAIVGYDPVDLVRGHYLSYQLALDQESMIQTMVNNPKVAGKPAIEDTTNRYAFSEACATRTDSKLRGVVLYNGDSPANCQTILPADFVRESHRFYIQQDHAQEIERAVREGRATVILRILSDTQVTADQLLVDGKVFGSR